MVSTCPGYQQMMSLRACLRPTDASGAHTSSQRTLNTGCASFRIRRSTHSFSPCTYLLSTAQHHSMYFFVDSFVSVCSLSKFLKTCFLGGQELPPSPLHAARPGFLATHRGQWVLCIYSGPYRDPMSTQLKEELFLICHVRGFRPTDSLDKFAYEALHPGASAGLKAADCSRVNRFDAAIGEFCGPNLRLKDGVCAVPVRVFSEASHTLLSIGTRLYQEIFICCFDDDTMQAVAILTSHAQIPCV